MNRLTDQQLLRDYAECRSKVAYAELVRRHVDLNYSAARRMVCDLHRAERARGISEDFSGRPCCTTITRSLILLAARGVSVPIRLVADDAGLADFFEGTLCLHVVDGFLL